MDVRFDWAALTIPVPATLETWAIVGAVTLLSLIAVAVLSNLSNGQVWNVKIKSKEWDNDIDPNKVRTVLVRQATAFKRYHVDKNSRTRGMYVWKQAVPFTKTASVILRAYKGLDANELHMHAQLAQRLGLVEIDPTTDEVRGPVEQSVRLGLSAPMIGLPWFLLTHPNRDTARDYRLFAAGIAIPILTPILTAVFLMWLGSR